MIITKGREPLWLSAFCYVLDVIMLCDSDMFCDDERLTPYLSQIRQAYTASGYGRSKPLPYHSLVKRVIRTVAPTVFIFHPSGRFAQSPLRYTFTFKRAIVQLPLRYLFFVQEGNPRSCPYGIFFVQEFAQSPLRYTFTFKRAIVQLPLRYLFFVQEGDPRSCPCKDACQKHA